MRSALGDSPSYCVFALCLVPCLGQADVSQCCCNPNPSLLVEARVKAEGLSELAMVTTINNSGSLLAKKKQSSRRLFCLYPSPSGGAQTACGHGQDRSSQLATRTVEQAVSSMVPSCQPCGWGRAGFLFVPVSCNKNNFSTKTFPGRKECLPPHFCAVCLHVETHLFIDITMHTQCQEDVTGMKRSKKQSVESGRHHTVSPLLFAACC